ncbi:MAG: hypothetical protein WDN04_01745 [Rhodospirillales bacterium]
MLWTVAGGVPRGALLGSAEAAEPGHALRFVQISDSHIGFAKPTNMDTPATLAAAIQAQKLLPAPPCCCIPATSRTCRGRISSIPPTRSSAAPASQRTTCPASTTC